MGAGSTRNFKGEFMRKSVGMSICSAFALASVIATLSPAAADDGVAGSVYYSIPFSGIAGDPHFGLRLDHEIEQAFTFAQDALTFGGDAVRPAMVDFQFTGDGPTALKFGGMDAPPIVVGPLGFHGGENEATEDYIFLGVGAVAGALITCAIAGCF